jgi:uncharacterized membrane protein
MDFGVKFLTGLEIFYFTMVSVLAVLPTQWELLVNWLCRKLTVNLHFVVMLGCTELHHDSSVCPYGMVLD